MMGPKKLIRDIMDHNLWIQERMYILLVSIGLLGLSIAILIGFFAGESMKNIIPLTITFVAMLILTWWSIHFRKIQTGAVLIGVVVIFFVLPMNFLTSGAIYGGGPVWFLFGVFFACLVVENRIKYVLITSSLLIQAGCYYVAYFYPRYTIPHTISVAYVDSYVTLLIVTLLICGMISFQNRIYKEENALAQRQKKEIEELNQMQNHFFSSMSHEIRTPINTIIGLNEMILREEVSDEVAADAKSIQGASKMLLSLINDILDMSKIESGRMDIVPVSYDVGAMLSDVVNMIWVRAQEKGLAFHVDVDQTIPSQLIGDEVRIKQILINVLNNAVKYTSEGSVTLSIRSGKREDNTAYITYSVTDTGMGIRKENIPYLFNAFRRVDAAKNRYIEGTGLGLAIVKQLVELMDGEIAVNSVYTKGSTFVITLPQGVEGTGQIGELDLETRHKNNIREKYVQSFEAPKAHVLIVDDNETNLMVAQKLLRATRVHIDTAVSGADCLKKTLQNKYEVIFMDHLMPNMDGIECLHAIRSQTGGLNLNTPVVVLTANAGSENRTLYRREGFDGYLVKPVSGIQLEQELLTHLPPSMVKIGPTAGSVGVVEAPVLEHKRRMTIMISTDSTSDLPRELAEKFQIAVLPFHVRTRGGIFLDGVEAESEGVLGYINKGATYVRSEAADVREYEEFFAQQLTRTQYIIHLSLAKNVGEGYSNAMEASKAFDNVIVMDSGHLSSGIGIMAMYAARCASEGMNVGEIVSRIEKLRENIHSDFIVSDTEYLAMAGRISDRINKFCQAFMLHPVIELRKSSMQVGAIYIGTRETAWNRYISLALKHRKTIDTSILFITYVGLNSDELKEIKQQVLKRVPFEKVICQKASPAVASNCGPGTFGLLYMRKDNM